MQGTLYKGKWHTAKQLGACKQETREPAQPRSGRSVQTSVNSGQRLWVYSHSVGGLTGAAYDEWMTFAHGPSVTAKFHIMVLQETGWTEHREYDTQDWHVVHSGASNNRYAGVMIMLNRRTFYADSIHTRVLVAGRLLHVRVGLRCAVDRHVDIIGIYQHAWNHSVPRAEMLARRDSVWTALGEGSGRSPCQESDVCCGRLQCHTQVIWIVSGTRSGSIRDTSRGCRDLTAYSGVMAADSVEYMGTQIQCRHLC